MAEPLTAEEERDARARSTRTRLVLTGRAAERLWATLDKARAELKQAKSEYRDAMKAVQLNAETIAMMQDQRDAARASHSTCLVCKDQVIPVPVFCETCFPDPDLEDERDDANTEFLATYGPKP